MLIDLGRQILSWCKWKFSPVTASVMQRVARGRGDYRVVADAGGDHLFILRRANYTSTSDDKPDENRGQKVSAYRHFATGCSTRRSKARNAARMTCDCLSPVSSVSRCKTFRSASVSRIVVFSKFDRCRMTIEQLQYRCRIVWRRYGGGRNQARNLGYGT